MLGWFHKQGLQNLVVVTLFKERFVWKARVVQELSLPKSRQISLYAECASLLFHVKFKPFVEMGPAIPLAVVCRLDAAVAGLIVDRGVVPMTLLPARGVLARVLRFIPFHGPFDRVVLSVEKCEGFVGFPRVRNNKRSQPFAHGPETGDQRVARAIDALYSGGLVLNALPPRMFFAVPNAGVCGVETLATIGFCPLASFFWAFGNWCVCVHKRRRIDIKGKSIVKRVSHGKRLAPFECFILAHAVLDQKFRRDLLERFLQPGHVVFLHFEFVSL